MNTYRAQLDVSRKSLTSGQRKSQLAIEWSYRVREHESQTWVFWIHCSNAARFVGAYSRIADKLKLPGRHQPQVDIIRLVFNWPSDEEHGMWMIILHNADDEAVFSKPREHKATIDDSEIARDYELPLAGFLPQVDHGRVLITSREQNAAILLAGNQRDVIWVGPMCKTDALVLLQIKLEGHFDTDSGTKLVEYLDLHTSCDSTGSGIHSSKIAAHDRDEIPERVEHCQ